MLQEPAKQLVEIWKKLVPSESAPAVQKRYDKTSPCNLAALLLFDLLRSAAIVSHGRQRPSDTMSSGL